MSISNSNWHMCNDVDMDVNSGGWEVHGRLFFSAIGCFVERKWGLVDVHL